MAKSKKRNQEKIMYSLVKQWINGTQYKKEFCAEHTINKNTFNYWLQKFRKKQKQSSKSNFIELKISDKIPTSNSKTIRLTYPNGVLAEISADTNIDIIRSLINS